MPSSAAPRAYGSKADTMDEALKDALAHEGPALVEIVTDALLI